MPYPPYAAFIVTPSNPDSNVGTQLGVIAAHLLGHNTTNGSNGSWRFDNSNSIQPPTSPPPATYRAIELEFDINAPINPFSIMLQVFVAFPPDDDAPDGQQTSLAVYVDDVYQGLDVDINPLEHQQQALWILLENLNCPNSQSSLKVSLVHRKKAAENNHDIDFYGATGEIIY